MDKRREIEILAYEFFQRDGCMHGREFEHWIEGLVSEKPAKAKKPVAAKAVSVKVAEKKSKTPTKAPAKGKVKKAGNS
jgi:Protein of unknown function (DUF2934)